VASNSAQINPQRRLAPHVSWIISYSVELGSAERRSAVTSQERSILRREIHPKALLYGSIRCSCEHCTAPSRFLASPVTETWTLKAAEQVRRHVEREIKAARADLDVRTERRGSPYSLVCRKNRASYERRVAQRRQDLADIASLSNQSGGL
jgi:hypothetical protein